MQHRGAAQILPDMDDRFSYTVASISLKSVIWGLPRILAAVRKPSRRSPEIKSKVRVL